MAMRLYGQKQVYYATNIRSAARGAVFLHGASVAQTAFMRDNPGYVE
jgi:hypothetical protein